MRCLQVNKFWYRRAGADIYAMDLAAQLASRRHRIRVLATAHPANEAHPDSDLWPKYRELSGGGRTLPLMQRPGAIVDLVYNRRAEQAVIALLAREPVDVAHVHNFTKHLSAAPLLALRERGVPLVATLHDHWPTCPTYSLVHGDGTKCEWECSRQGVSRCIVNRCVSGSTSASVVAALEAKLQRTFGWGLDLFDLVVSPSQFLADSLQHTSFASSKVRVVPHPRMRHEWEPPPSGVTQVFFAGRLAREKGVEHLIEAARGAGWQLTIAGKGPYETELRALAGDLPNVRFVGVLSSANVIGGMRASHVIAVPSTWYENAPLVVLEALAVGRVVVASEIGGIPEYLRADPWGRLVRPGSSDALRAAIDEIAADSGRRSELGRAAWESSAAAPGWSEHVDVLERAFSQLPIR